MTGFLTQLVARGLGQADVARPRPVSRFEPLGSGDASPLASVAPQTEGLDLAEETVTSAARPSPRRARPPSSTPLIAEEPADEPAPSTSRSTSPTRLDLPAPTLASPTVAPDAAPSPRVTVVVRDPGAGPADDGPDTQPVTPSPLRVEAPALTPLAAPAAPPDTVPTTPAPSAPIERILLQPEIRPLAERPAPPSSAPGLLPPAPSGPTVHVTIGRLEVRATPPPSSAKPSRSTEPTPPVRLDDYLRQRGERGTP